MKQGKRRKRFGRPRMEIGCETLEIVPEPSTMLLLGSGLIGLAGLRKKFKK